MPKNDELKAILDARNVSYDEKAKNATLVKLVKESEPKTDDAEPNVTGQAKGEMPEGATGVTPEDVKAAKAENPEAKPTKGGTKIERINETTGTWWCPICDHANGDTVKDCGGCKATRDGDKVK